MNAQVRIQMKTLSAQIQRAGPYLLLELLLPGGTLFALLLFIYRQRMQRPRPVQAPRAKIVAMSTIAGARHALLPHGVYAIAGAGAVAPTLH